MALFVTMTKPADDSALCSSVSYMDPSQIDRTTSTKTSGQNPDSRSVLRNSLSQRSRSHPVIVASHCQEPPTNRSSTDRSHYKMTTRWLSTSTTTPAFCEYEIITLAVDFNDNTYYGFNTGALLLYVTLGQPTLHLFVYIIGRQEQGIILIGDSYKNLGRTVR